MATEIREPWSPFAASPTEAIRVTDGDPVIVDADSGERLSFGDIVADRVTRAIGSWRFILIYFVLLWLWMAINTVAWLSHWDPYPFIFLNLLLSFQGAFAAPIILMSQNRQEDRDRQEEQSDHLINLRAEHEVTAVQTRMEELNQAYLASLAALQDELRAFHARLETALVRLENSDLTIPNEFTRL
jgi:uncharacterized membrane protein